MAIVSLVPIILILDTLFVRGGKGRVARSIDLSSKAIAAIKNYQATRPQVNVPELFLNRYGEPITERGVRKLVVKYRELAGISKKASCHALRHTFATAKAEAAHAIITLTRTPPYRIEARLHELCIFEFSR